MLHELTDDGHMRWQCPTCQETRTAHISHEEVRYPENSDMVALPRCDCGTQTFLKVTYTEDELQPPRIHKDNQGKIIKVEFDGSSAYQLHTHIEHDHAGRPYTVCDDVTLHPAIPRHQALVAQLAALGKGEEKIG